MAKAGSVWIDDYYIYFIANGYKWRFMGTSLGSSPGRPGSIWVG